MPDRDAAIKAVREAGDMALDAWREGMAPATKVWEKSKGNPVSDTDLAVDALLKQRLGALAPNIGWLSEETVDNPDRLSMSRQWLVDPIDGTRDYIRGRNGWCVSVALAEGSEIVFAAMYAPVTSQLWVAHKGEGTMCNGKRLFASNRKLFTGARVPTDALPKADRDLEMVHKPNSIAMRMAMVACDRADLVATLRWGHEWDIAAAHLIAEEAGAVVTNAAGMPILYNKREPMDFGLICCAPGIHDAAVERLRDRAQGILQS
ncbi:MAG: 3'(2'),5'-bisphosphate nucleotidase CysQ [Sphingomonadales bacterium]|nr:3'(2'),5'-bisphosphate nucleotidase CysQ [Sphingomonadales bacterium]MBK9004336.1 3'(2'),5'-bisphosphate nucleotidase CysQ [Sphingomonadales bacterium]MBK9269513.1 3'(2'),5'-bisphosphate nucleotidase CysQ [Sphingomonadales bacterium]MBP6435238.1 3'(2'),5'-bisphosphate nucleotidase CysQ [Sphingorhabdus sp.]